MDFEDSAFTKSKSLHQMFKKASYDLNLYLLFCVYCINVLHAYTYTEVEFLCPQMYMQIHEGGTKGGIQQFVDMLVEIVSVRWTCFCITLILAESIYFTLWNGKTV